MWYSSGDQTIRIYDEKLTLLKSVQGKMTFTFDANKLYLIYVRFPINDNYSKSLLTDSAALPT